MEIISVGNKIAEKIDNKSWYTTLYSVGNEILREIISALFIGMMYKLRTKYE